MTLDPKVKRDLNIALEHAIAIVLSMAKTGRRDEVQIAELEVDALWILVAEIPGSKVVRRLGTIRFLPDAWRFDIAVEF